MLRPLVLGTLLSLSLSLTACGGGEGSDEAPASAGTTTAEVPDGLTPTDPGTELELGDPATLVWQPETGLTGVLDLTVESVAEQHQSVLDGWLRDEAMKQARPYFVTVSVSNAGETDLSGQVVPLYLRDERGTLGAPWTLGGDFTACQSGPLPAPYEPGAASDLCLVFLAPDGARIEDIVFEPTEGYDPISWTGEVQAPPRR